MSGSKKEPEGSKLAWKSDREI